MKSKATESGESAIADGEAPEAMPFAMTRQSLAYIDQLVEMGIFGFDRADVILRMIDEGIRARIVEGFLPWPGKGKRRS